MSTLQIYAASLRPLSRHAGLRLRWHSTVGEVPRSWAAKRENLEQLPGRERFMTPLNKVHLKGERTTTPAQLTGGKMTNEERTCLREVQTLGRARQWQEALLLYYTVPNPHLVLRVTAMDACAKALNLPAARRIFDDMPERTAAAYTTLISMLGRMRRIGEAEELMQEMRGQQIAPDAATYTALIIAQGMVHRSEAAERLLDQAEAAGFKLSEVEFGAAISACGKAGDSVRAKRIMERMEKSSVQPHVGHFTSLIISHARSKDSARAAEVLAEMRKRGLQLDSVVYTAMLSCLEGPDALAKADALTAEMRQEGIKPHLFFFDEWLRLAIDGGDKARFDSLLAEMKELGIEHNHVTLGHVRRAEHRFASAEPHAEAPSPAGLPEGWMEAVDQASGHRYYWHVANPAGTTTWDRPA